MTGMVVVPAVEINAGNLVSSIPAADYPAYSPSTTYNTGQSVTLGNMNYEALKDGVVGKDPTSDRESWLVLGWTNRYRMFNKRVEGTWRPGTFSSASEAIEVTLSLTGRVNSLGLIGVSAYRIHVTVVDPASGETVYDRETLTAVKNSGSWYQYYFGGFTGSENQAYIDLPPVLNPQITVRIEAPGGTAKVGMLVAGWSRGVGVALYGTAITSRTFSTIEEGFDGSVTITPRGKRRTVNYAVEMHSDDTSKVLRILEPLSDTAALYVGVSELDYTITVGFYEELSIGLPDYGLAEYNLEVRSLY